MTTKPARNTVLPGALVALALTLGACGAGEAATETTVVETAESSETEPTEADHVMPADHEQGEDLELVLADIPAGELTEDEIDGLLWMREEEKLARDVYLTLYDLWGLRPFTNISNSEQSHMDSVAALLERYDIDDPVTDDTIGVFTDPTLQGLYDDLVAQGSQSVETALAVGVMIEELDIVDLQARATTTEDIALIYANLEKGSRNHLRAFSRQLDRYDVDYEPQFLPVDEFEAIIASGNESGVEH